MGFSRCAWRVCDPRFDLDGSGTVDFADFFLFAEHFGQPARARLVAMARELIGLPEGPQLRQNAPNPFNSGTVISWLQLQPGVGAAGGVRADGPAGGGAARGAAEGGPAPACVGTDGTTGAACWPAGSTCTGWSRPKERGRGS